MTGADEQTPDRLVAGRYQLESVLGRGGMGVVWQAVDTLIERRVALKELRAPSGVTQSDESSFVERSLREARNAGRLNHPGVVAVHDVIAPAGDDDAVYIVMEYVQAPTLEEVLEREGALPASRVAALGLGILDAVMAAHTMGIVHRDIKPANVLVREGDRVKLTDFGIALAAEDTRLTRSGVIGTHSYLAPECFDAGQAGPAADLWALGATLFHAVAGQAPFDRDTTTATLRAILFEDPPAPPCDGPLAEVISGLLTRPIDQRLTGGAARQLLEKVAEEPVSSKPTADSPPTAGAGQAAWEASATTVHRAPTPSPPAQSWGQPTHPGTAPQPQPQAQPQPAGWGGGPPTPAPQPAQTPGWAQAGSTSGGYQAAQKKNMALPIILGLVGVGVVIIAILLAGGGDGGGGGSTSSPDAAVRGLIEAVIDGDCERAATFVTENFGAECPDNSGEGALTSLNSVRTVSQEGTTARVEATIGISGGEESDLEFNVIQVDGEWKVDDIVIADLDIPEVPEVDTSLP